MLLSSQDDATSATLLEGKVAAVAPPLQVGYLHRPRLSVKLDELSFRFLDNLALPSFDAGGFDLDDSPTWLFVQWREQQPRLKKSQLTRTSPPMSNVVAPVGGGGLSALASDRKLRFGA